MKFEDRISPETDQFDFAFWLRRRDLFLMAGISGIALTFEQALAQSTTAKKRAGTANFVEGDVRVTDDSGIRVLTSGSVIREGQTIETAANSETHVVFDDGGFLAVRPSSRILIEKANIAGSFDDSLSMRLLAGAMRSITGWIGKFDKHNYQLSTTITTVGIRGTDHELAIIGLDDESHGEISGVHNWVREGGTTLKTSAGEIDINPGHAAWAPHTGEIPRAHDGIPSFLQQLRTRHEARIEAHARRINDHIEMRMKKRGLLREGERLADAQRRHHELRGLGNLDEDERLKHFRAEREKVLSHRKK